MTKAVKVTNDDPSNSAKVTWSDSRTGPWHYVNIAPGEFKTVDPIPDATMVKVEAVTDPVAVSVENVGTVNLSTRLPPSGTGDIIAPGVSMPYTITGPYGYVDIVAAR